MTTALLVGLAGAYWLSLLQLLREHRPADVPAVLGLAAGIAAFGVPLLLGLLPVMMATHRRRRVAAVPAAIECAAVAALALAAANQLRLTIFGDAQPGLPVFSLLGDAVALLVVLVPLSCLVAAMRTVTLDRSRSFRRATLVLTAGLAVLVSMSMTTSPAVGSPSATAAGCLNGGGADRSYDVTSLDVDIPINRFGDHDPKGKMYALTSRVDDIRKEELSQKVSIGLRDDAIQPLVIRANEGECVEITYTNGATGGDFGLHIDGLEFNQYSSGDTLGSNDTSAVAPGASRTYRFAIPDDRRMEGGHYVHPGPGYRAAVDHGLFGALVVEPPGSTYWNASKAGVPLESGWEAIIKPNGMEYGCDPTDAQPSCAFREAALLHHEIGNDNELLKNKLNVDIPLVDNTTGSYRPGAFALNYRSEPFRNRLLSFPKEKSHAYSSFTFGDPSTPMVRGYLADPTKIRLMHVGAEKFHIFHLHGGGDRWRFNPVADTSTNYAVTGLKKSGEIEESASNRLDSQSIGPGESYNLEIEGGAGGVQQSAGDFLYHCHIAKHYVSGMWSVWRVYDTYQKDLAVLPDRLATPPPTAVDSRGLLGLTINGTTITKDNIDDWIRPQLPPAGVPKTAQDATVWDWKVSGTADQPLYLGAPGNQTVAVSSPKVVPGQPNLLAVDIGHLEGNRPAILFNPLNGRPAYPLLRTAIGKRPPFTAAGHTGTPYLGNTADKDPSSAADPWATRKDGLCPQDSYVRKYNIVAIGKSIQRTPAPALPDPEGKLFVLAQDKAATLADPNKSDPLAIRANEGDCVAITLTSEIPDASAFDKFSKTSMHIHHVQFDVQGSDGVSAGFAYEHSVRPYTVTDATLTSDVAKGETVLHLTSVASLIGKDANGNATHPWIAIGEGTESIDIHQVQSVDPVALTVTLTTGADFDHGAGQYAGTEFIQYRWFPDVLLDNVFWHDHVDGIHGWGHGLVGQLIVEPHGSTYHDPTTGDEVKSGTIVDIHTSDPLAPGVVDGSFRELALWTFDDNDKGAYASLNLKANPLAGRPDKTNQFSSYTYGDPMTPLPRLYPNDPLVIRTINISPTLDTLHVQGGRTLLEPRYVHPDAAGNPAPAGGIIDSVHYGVSEKFSLIFNGDRPELRMRPGDYLYANGVEVRTQQGAWGIVRVLPSEVSTLKALPDIDPNPAPPQPLCPSTAPTRTFNISALDRSGTFNGGRTAFVPNADVANIKARLKDPAPLVLHVVAGECVTVNVTNLLTTPVGFSVGKLDREQGSGGVNVGFSPNQNVAPAATRAYKYYVDSDRIGTAVIADLASATRSKAGLYGVVVVSPASTLEGQRTRFSDPVTGNPRDIGAQVLVNVPGAAEPDYRDFTVTIADDDKGIGQDFMPYPTNALIGRSLVNYQAAPAGDGPDAFKDPGKVPWLTSLAGDPMMVHVLVSPGSESGHVFSLGGLSWDQDPNMDNSNLMTAQGMGPWETFNAKINGGAGGTQQEPGTYFYGDLRRPFTAVGLWGLQKVLPANSTSCPVLKVNGTRC